MRLSLSLTKNLSDDEVKRLAEEIKHSVLAKAMRRFLREQIELSYRSEEAADTSQEHYPLYLKEVGERRGYRQVLHLIPEE